MSAHPTLSVQFNEAELPQVAQQLLEQFADSRIFLLQGDLGAGKTTLVQALVRQLGSVQETSSPTFGLINEYATSQGTVYHLDLYRLKNADELWDLGVMELLDSGNFCFVEWPEMVLQLVADPAVQILLTAVDANTRKLTANAYI